MANYQREIEFISDLRGETSQLLRALEESFATIHQYEALGGAPFFAPYMTDEGEEPGLSVEELQDAIQVLTNAKAWMGTENFGKLYKVKG